MTAARISAGLSAARRPLCLAAILALAACAPLSVDQAERECVKDARIARAPSATFGIALDSRGQVLSKSAITVSSDYLVGRDPADVFNECVKRRSGKFPSRSLTDMPEWRS